MNLSDNISEIDAYIRLLRRTRQDKTHILPVLVCKRFLRQFKVFFLYGIYQKKRRQLQIFLILLKLSFIEYTTWNVINLKDKKASDDSWIIMMHIHNQHDFTLIKVTFEYDFNCQTGFLKQNLKRSRAKAYRKGISVIINRLPSASDVFIRIINSSSWSFSSIILTQIH